MSEKYNEKKARRTLDLLREECYDTIRPDSMLINDLLNVVMYLDRQLKAHLKRHADKRAGKRTKRSL